MLKRRGRGRKMANDLLAEVGIPVKSKIDLDVVIKRLSEKRKLSIEVTYEDFSKDMTGVSAILINEKGKAVIAVNSNHHEARQRFSIAHELGHLVMHGNDQHLKVEKGLQRRLFTRAEGVHGIDEREANEFAAELLMPEEFIKRDFDKHISKEEDNIISYLADRYNVSEIAMQYRLNNLDLIDVNG